QRSGRSLGRSTFPFRSSILDPRSSIIGDEILSAYSRLPGPRTAPVVDAQATRDAPWADGNPPDRAGGPVEREKGKPAAARVVGMGAPLAVYPAQRLDGAPTSNAARGGPQALGPGRRAGHPPDPDRLGRFCSNAGPAESLGPCPGTGVGGDEQRAEDHP